MERSTILGFQEFLFNATRKNSQKRLGERTISGCLTLAKHIAETEPGLTIFRLNKIHKEYLEKRNHPVARYALWMYLKYLGYDEKIIKEVVDFKRRSSTALTDEEKLAKSVLSKKELFYLVEKIKKPRDNLIVRLLYDTGARVSEITNLQLKDIDMRTREIQLMGKGRKPRTVYFQQSTSILLQNYLKEDKIENPNALVFPIKPITVWYNLKKYGKEILNRDLRPHMLRHSRLQHMADEGVDSFLIKSYAGHSDIGTTQIYVKSSKFQGKIAFEKAGDVWKELE